MLAHKPFAIAWAFNPLAVPQQVQRPRRTAVRHLQSEVLLSPAQGRKVGHRPVQACHQQDAARHASRLPKW